MEPTRPLFWNIHEVPGAEAAFYLVMLLTISLFAWNVYRRVQLWSAGKPEQRFDRPWERLWGTVQYALVQARVLTDMQPGLVHGAIYAGIGLLFLGTVLATLDQDVAYLVFKTQFLRGNFYLLYKLVLDIAGLMAATGLLFAAIRRFWQKPPRLNGQWRAAFAWDDAYTLLILAVIVVTGFCLEGIRLASDPFFATIRMWSPVGNVIALLIAPLGPAFLRSAHVALWWFHALLAFLAIVTLPYTKLWHVLTAFLNIYFRDLRPAGAIPAIYDIEGMFEAAGEEVPSFGASKLADFTWKQRLDWDAALAAAVARTIARQLSPRNLYRQRV